jgi:hypothetical protein
MSLTAEVQTGAASSTELEVIYRIANAPMRTYPFPHFFLRDVFPADYYRELLAHLPGPETMHSLMSAGRAKGCPERAVLQIDGSRAPGMTDAQHAFWHELARWFFGGRFGPAVLEKFQAWASPRVEARPGHVITDELLLVRDATHYALGPHTDASFKLISLLFYLPADACLEEYGTSLYLPKQEGFTSEGGPHLRFEDFTRIATMPFVPNSLFAFVKSDHSFHGVEPIAEPGVARWLLLYSLRLMPEERADGPAPGA